MKKLIIAVLSAAMLASYAVLPTLAAGDTETISYTYSAGDGKTYTREMEKLGRGLIAIKTDNGVYLSWRLLDSEDNIFGSASANVSFNIYRGSTKIASVADVTNYTDKNGQTSSTYSVAPVTGGIEGDKCAAVDVQNSSYFDIAVEQPTPASLPEYVTENKWNYFIDGDGNKVTNNDWRDESTSYKEVPYTINDCSVGDVDGDGEYEIIVKWDAGGQDNSYNGVTGNVLLQAYKMHGNGKPLWTIDLGRNIRAGAHYTQFLVYDFDGDGKAEITCKTAPNSKDGTGAYVTAASHISAISSISSNFNDEADYRNSSGYILEGDEYLTIFNGLTGKAIDTIYYPNQLVDPKIWGDGYGGRCDRFTAAVAYMDGIKPYAVYMRGYYMRQSGGIGERQAACAVSFDGKTLDCKYSFDTYNVDTYSSKSSSSSYADGVYKGVKGYVKGNEIYPGEGNHNCTVADVDNDGKDEVMTGALCYEINDDDRLAVKWCTFLEHGDALHIGDYDPLHKGLEFMTVHEDGFSKIGTDVYNKFSNTKLEYGASVIDAETGELLFHESNDNDTGRGIMANIGAGGYYQIYAYAQHSGAPSGASKFEVGPYIANGNTSFTKATSFTSMSQNFRIFWDGDLFDELLDGTAITSWNGSRIVNVFDAKNYNCTSVNGTKANPGVQADLFGDWREEIVYPTTDNSSLRVFSTTDASDYKIKTLMHDPVYRSGVAAEQTAYNQPPHIGFYLSEEAMKGGVEALEVTASKTQYKVGESLDRSTITVKATYKNGDVLTIDDYDIVGYDSTVAGSQTVTIYYSGCSENITITTVSGFDINSEGLITGYHGTASTETLPNNIDGVNVTGIADGALSDSSVTKLYIYNDPITFGTNSLPEGVTIACYEGSAAYEYAVENNIKYELIKPILYFTNVTFEEDGYSGIDDNDAIVTQKANKDDIVTIPPLTFTAINRGGQGDEVTGIYKHTIGSNAYLEGRTGKWNNANRHAYIQFDNTAAAQSANEYVLEFDFMIPSNSLSTTISVLSSSGKISSGNSNVIYAITAGKDSVAADTWYKYALNYNNGAYTQTITSEDGSSVLKPAVTNQAVPEYIAFTANNSGTGSAYIDNLTLYAPIISTVTLNITDSLGTAVPNAEVTLNGVTKTTDKNGSVTFTVASGKYTIDITHPQLNDYSTTVIAYAEKQSKDITLDSVLPKPTATPSPSPVPTSTPVPTATPTPVPTATASPSQAAKVLSVSGSTVSVNVPSPDSVVIYAAKYNNGILTNVKQLVPGQQYENTFTNIGFEPDKVFIWADNMVPVDLWTKPN